MGRSTSKDITSQQNEITIRVLLIPASLWLHSHSLHNVTDRDFHHSGLSAGYLMDPESRLDGKCRGNGVRFIVFFSLI